MTPKIKQNRINQSISYEKTIIDYYLRNPGKDPDGSFVMNMYNKGYRDAKKEFKREMRKFGPSVS